MKSFDKNNCYAYQISNNTTAKGYFNIYQARSGGIYIQMGITVTALTETQITDLGLSVYELKDFSHDDYIKHYRAEAPGLPTQVKPCVIFPKFTEPIAEIVGRKQNGIDCSEEESGMIKHFLIENSDKILIDGHAKDNDDYISSLFPCEYSEAWQMIEEKIKCMDNCLICNIAIPDSEDFCDECFNEMEQRRECEFCSRPLNDHNINCPENESPFAQLIQKGYD